MASHFQDMGRLRRRTLLAAFVYGIIFSAFWAWTEASGSSIMGAVYGLPTVVLVPFLLFHSLLTAVVVVELVRAVLDRRQAWSSRRHLYAVVICWILLFFAQVPVMLHTRA